MKRVVTGSLRAILSCNFTTLDPAIFRHRFVDVLSDYYLSLSMIPFKKCVMRWNCVTICIPKLTASCQRGRVVAVKVIRLHMSWVEELLSADPELRVVQLVRDPRGILESWRKVSATNMTEMEMRFSADLLCRRMAEDCETRRRLEELFPGRIVLVRYEDLVTDTYHVLRSIYTELLQLQMPTSVRKELARQMKADSDDGSAGTKRKNGKATAYQWKQEIDREYLGYVNNTCRSVISLLNYDKP